jgi:PAS domain S-box-containing protein
MHPDDRVRVVEGKRRAIEGTGSFWSDEFRHRRADGSYAHVADHGFILRDAHGKAVRMIGAMQDVTERKRAEAALREGEERFRQFAENSADALWIVDAQTGRPEYLSPSYEEIWGEPRDGVMRDIGRWAALLHPDDRARALSTMPRALAGETVCVEYRIVRPSDGAVRWIRDTGFPIRGADGRIRRVGGIAQDVTEEKAAEERLRELNEALEARVAARTAELRQALSTLHSEVLEREQAEERLRQSEKLKAIGQLTGGIAHDLNNMLQTITNGLSMVRTRLAQGRPGDVLPYVERAGRGTERAAALTHRLLAFGRQQTLRPKPISLDRIARDVEDMVRRTVSPAVQVELKLADGHWLVMCDPNQMESALLNLCVNARDAMPEGGWLTVSTEKLVLSEADVANHEGAKPGRYATIAVTDTGTGMTPEVLAHVFEPFFTTKPLGQGTGLGLSQIYGFVRQSGGVVQIDSAPGKGTTVRLCLPFHARNPDDGQAWFPRRKKRRCF